MINLADLRCTWLLMAPANGGKIKVFLIHSNNTQIADPNWSKCRIQTTHEILAKKSIRQRTNRK